ncbi:MAG: glutathione S-transferase family protein [Candidatus Saccharibacteria bacterium]|nr:glutathione S-transferase family protein [Pseudorhodobacter sp.]
MHLYYAPNSIALVTLIVLEEVGAPYTATRLDLAAGMQRQDDYTAINPKGRVPSLVTDHGILTETPAILTYLAQIYPSAKLMPGDPFQAARVQEMLSYLCSTVHVSHAHKGRGYRWSDDPQVIAALKLKVGQNITDHFTYLEGRFTGPWAMGEDYSVADPYLYVLTRWAGPDGADLSQCPKILGHMAAMAARPAVQRALAVQG